MRKFALTFLIAGSVLCVHAQEAAEAVATKTKKIDHYVGVQINGLIRQVLNFSNSASTTPLNPYLVTYSANLAKSGWGVRLGVGYTHTNINEDNGVSAKETRIDDKQLRFGIEKRFTLGKKWTAGAGLDGVYGNANNYTKTVVTSFDTTITVTDSKLPTFGRGAMGWLRYHITEHILVGTETSFYYVKGTEDRRVELTRRTASTVPPFNSVLTTTITRTKPTLTDASFRLPVVFYLIVQF